MLGNEFSGFPGLASCPSSPHSHVGTLIFQRKANLHPRPNGWAYDLGLTNQGRAAFLWPVIGSGMTHDHQVEPMRFHLTERLEMSRPAPWGCQGSRMEAQTCRQASCPCKRTACQTRKLTQRKREPRVKRGPKPRPWSQELSLVITWEKNPFSLRQFKLEFCPLKFD